MQIKSIIGKSNNRYNSQETPWEIVVQIEIDNKEFLSIKKKHDLAHLYCVTVSNAIYSFNSDIPASKPYVDATRRASKGLKTITLSYFLSSPEIAQKLGLKVVADKYGSYGDYVDILNMEQPEVSQDDTEEGSNVIYVDFVKKCRVA